jgi:hypothetical protein
MTSGVIGANGRAASWVRIQLIILEHVIVITDLANGTVI